MRTTFLVAKKHTLIVIGVLLAVAVASYLLLALHAKQATAAEARYFNPGRIIDDVVFYNAGAMTTDQIQAFLNAKVPACDTNGTGLARYDGHTNPTPYQNETRAQYAQRKGWHGPPYTCMRDYRQNTPQMEAASGLCTALPAGNNRTAAQIINDVAKACGINPQVLIVLLQKEQSLVTDIWPLQIQYRNATGFACPDTAPCDPNYNGFFYQVYHAARQFKVYQKYPTSYNYIAGRSNRIYWHPDLSRCGSSNVFIENQATAALYVYTPYRPNQAALNNLYGTGDSCSSYGNRNFWRLFTDWFGSTLKDTVRPELATRYSALGGTNGVMGKLLDNGYCDANKTVCWQSFANGSIIWSPTTGAWESKGGIRDRWAQLGYQAGKMGFPTGGENYDGKGWWQAYQNGAIIGTSKTGFWESMGPIRERWGSIGYQQSFMGYPKGKVTEANGNREAWQEYDKGYIFWSEASGAWESTGAIRSRWAQLGYQTGVMGFPTGPENYDGKGWWQAYQHGVIIGSPKTGYWESRGPIRTRWAQTGYQGGFMGYPKGPVVTSADKKTSWQEYETGYLYWTEGLDAWESKGGIRAQWAQMGYAAGRAGAPVGPEQYNTTTKTWYQAYQHGTIYHSTAKGGWFEAK